MLALLYFMPPASLPFEAAVYHPLLLPIACALVLTCPEYAFACACIHTRMFTICCDRTYMHVKSSSHTSEMLITLE